MAHSYGVVPPDNSKLIHIDQLPILTTQEFARMHLEHITAHPPDSILFPFLHGLDGDNDAQCTFFSNATSPDKPPHTAGMILDKSGRVLRPPRYRGLVWVVCDDDIDGPVSPLPEETEYDTDSDDFSEDGHDVEMGLDQDPPMDIDPTALFHAPHHSPHRHRKPAYKHQHSQSQSQSGPSQPLDILYTNPCTAHDRRPSSTSSSGSSTDVSSSDSHSRSTSATSLPSPTSPPCTGQFEASASDTTPQSQSVSAPIVSSQKPRKKYPVLTCTFSPSQLIQPCPPSRTYDFHSWSRGDTAALKIDWEFKPARVPDGISLRNFGIQLPLYISVSDIVVYSPKGISPTALRIAARFKKAVDKKRRERLEKWVQAGLEQTPGGEDRDSHTTPEGFFKYGVYILNADAEQLERDLPWLIVRKDGECSGDCDRAVQTQTQNVCHPVDRGMTHGLTEATDGRLVGELEIEAKLAAEEAEYLSASGQPIADFVTSFDQTSGAPRNMNTRIHRCKRANTIDFAQREKDEMRDLTRASEILTVWNSDDRDVQADEASGSTTATVLESQCGSGFSRKCKRRSFMESSIKTKGTSRAAF
ncbi:hypothetical protein JVU11DRAFT_4038 [Chiua virens]|nr:hypothetical protein JVU11DRAFT_4038 [Chiua virens]